MTTKKDADAPPRLAPRGACRHLPPSSPLATPLSPVLRVGVPRVGFGCAASTVYFQQSCCFIKYRKLARLPQVMQCRVFFLLCHTPLQMRGLLYWNFLYKNTANYLADSFFFVWADLVIRCSPFDPVHSIIIESRQTRCPIWRMVQGTGN